MFRPQMLAIFRLHSEKLSISYTVIPRLTSDPANEDFFAVFQTWLTNVLVDALT